MLSDMPEMCQDFFNFFAEIFVGESVFCRATTYRGSPLGDLPQIYGTAYQVREETGRRNVQKNRGLIRCAGNRWNGRRGDRKRRNALPSK